MTVPTTAPERARAAPQLLWLLWAPPLALVALRWVLDWQAERHPSAPVWRLQPFVGTQDPWAWVAPLAGALVALALAGIALAWLRYGRGRAVAAPEAVQEAGALRTLVARGYFFDAFYDGVVVRGMGWLSATVLARGVEAPLARNLVDRPSRGGRAGGTGLAAGAGIRDNSMETLV